MKSFAILSVLMAFSFAHAGTLDIQAASRVFVLPVDLSTCQSATSTVAAPSFEVKPISYQWNSADTSLLIQYIQVIVEGPELAQPYKCVISGDELKTTLYPIQNAVIGAGDSSVYRSSCGLRCGGLPLAPNVEFAFLHGKVTVVGLEYGEGPELKKVATEVPVSFQYTSL